MEVFKPHGLHPLRKGRLAFCFTDRLGVIAPRQCWISVGAQLMSARLPTFAHQLSMLYFTQRRAQTGVDCAGYHPLAGQK